MLLVATTGPDDEPPICEFIIVDAELDSVFREVVEGNAVEPDSWLARGALVTLMVFDLATPSVAVGKEGVVVVRRRGACASRSPFAGSGAAVGTNP